MSKRKRQFLQIAALGVIVLSFCLIVVSVRHWENHYAAAQQVVSSTAELTHQTTAVQPQLSKGNVQHPASTMQAPKKKNRIHADILICELAIIAAGYVLYTASADKYRRYYQNIGKESLYE